MLKPSCKVRVGRKKTSQAGTTWKKTGGVNLGEAGGKKTTGGNIKTKERRREAPKGKRGKPVWGGHQAYLNGALKYPNGRTSTHTFRRPKRPGKEQHVGRSYE